MLDPFEFTPILVQRVWGGASLTRFGKPIPHGQRIGESWEISDRPDAQSVVANGPARGQTLHQLVATLGPQLLGTHCPTAASFPLLIKLLDARERLSLQVHPPAAIAPQLGGEPKTEMWYVLEADPAAHLIAGLRHGATREAFCAALRQSKIANPHSTIPLADLLHRFPVSRGDAFFVPSGRLHAIDAGVVLVEIQQNSDTTYRVYDWDRVGLDGKPRPLHLEQSLACIDFHDFEPTLARQSVEPRDGNTRIRVVECPEFAVHKLVLRQPWNDACDGSTFHVLTGLEGTLALRAVGHSERTLVVGQSLLLPAALGPYTLSPQSPSASALKTFLPPPPS